VQSDLKASPTSSNRDHTAVFVDARTLQDFPVDTSPARNIQPGASDAANDDAVAAMGTKGERVSFLP